MSKSPRQKPSTKLRVIGVELRALGHLIETQRNPETLPTDLEEIRWGLGSLLSRFSRRVQTVSREIDQLELRARSRDNR